MAEEKGRLRLAAAHGLPSEARSAFDLAGSRGALALGFLNFDQANGHTHIFLENAQQALHLSEDERRTAALLDLNYYLPCRVQDGSITRTIAVIGLGRTVGGDFLSSEDVELLESLASYIGIALQNASLYSRLESKITEFERLKEFNENIVESINVGILAIDLDDRIESWNAQMEAMYAMSRGEAIGQVLRSVFPSEFCDGLDKFRSESGVHNLYKFRLTTRAGEQRTVNAAIAPLLSRDFKTVGRIILVDDITERVTLEAQLAQTDKLSSIGLLAAGVAHEINTPAGRDLQLCADAREANARRCPPGPGAGEDHAAELPRGGDRQRPAQLLAHIDDRVQGDQSEPGHPRHAFAAGAPVQDGAGRGGTRSHARPAADSRQLRQAATGVSQPVA